MYKNILMNLIWQMLIFFSSIYKLSLYFMLRHNFSFFPSLDITPLSAPAFSFCFLLLNAKLRESSGTTEEVENMMIRALQIVMEHCKLRASTDAIDFTIDEVNKPLCIFQSRLV